MIQVDITATNDIFNDRFFLFVCVYVPCEERCVTYARYTFYYGIKIVLSFSDRKEGVKCRCIQTSVQDVLKSWSISNCIELR
jgi:hypothetical protein